MKIYQSTVPRYRMLSLRLAGSPKFIHTLFGSPNSQRRDVGGGTGEGYVPMHTELTWELNRARQSGYSVPQPSSQP